MNTPKIVILVLTLTVAAGCWESTEREEGPEHAASEAGETAEGRMIELPADLLSGTGVTVEAARDAALARLPGGELVAGELEEEDGRLIYSFDIRLAGREGIEEVHVDALTGEVIAQEHEGSAEEEAEARGDDGR